MTTYSREHWFAACQAWQEGEFGERWDAVRQAAANAGVIYPPTGSPDDDRDAEHPSPRAVIWRAIEDQPRWLLRVVAQSRSWSQVVAAVIANEGGLREDARLAEPERPRRNYAPPSLAGEILEHMRGTK